ncbi:MAG: chorismate mutase [Coriobacteriia bacterium]|nr:chorismate mutase [Coriobacteriia bacterium]
MDINEIRSKIDEIDEDILNAFIERMSLSEQVAEYKVAHNLPLENIEREQAVLQRALANAGQYECLVHAFFCKLMQLSKERQLQLYPSLGNGKTGSAK